ncbi:hypothetical protein C0993_011118, partial [Termitomyces sp. T159_Od127]
MSLSLKIPDAADIHRLLCEGADDRIILKDVTFLKKTENDSYIFKAKKSGEDVIVKFTYEDGEDMAIPRLEHESQIYVDYLKPLWGVHVPKFYGFYLYNSSDPDELSCACIVLQYCGEPAVSDLSELNDYRGHEYGIKRFRNDTIDLVFRLHSPEIGIEHDALNASHILDFKGKPFLVDFGGAEFHDCLAWQDVKLTRDSMAPKEGEVLPPFGSPSLMCYELFTFLKSIKYCLPSSIEYDGMMFVCKSITSAAALYERALKGWPKFRPAKELWDEAVTHWQSVRSNWKKYHPDAVVEPPLGIIDFE